ncbi:MAG TPA: hypothetical protein ENJ22_01025 [Gammaproteobacteria bacterium]|nr:hypothetical protein [Gammaproteobacteria bacterium]
MSRDEAYPLLSHEQRLIQAHAREDEISLVDLWLVLTRRKSLVLAGLFLGLGLGLAFHLAFPDRYEYATVVEIGTTLIREGAGEASRLIDSPETVLAKIRESYIPWALNRHLADRPGDQGRYRLDAEIPRKSDLVVVRGKGTMEDEPVYLALLNSVLERLFSDHGRQTAVVRSRLESQLVQARTHMAALQDPATLAVKKKALEDELNGLRIQLEELRDPRILKLKVQKLETELEQKRKVLTGLRNRARLYQAQYKRLDQVDELLSKQISDLQAEIDAALAQRRKAVGKVGDAGTAMAMLLIDNEIQQNRNRLAALQERYFIQQKNAREELLNKIEENRRQQEVESKIIERLKGERDKLQFDNQRSQARLIPKISLVEEKLRKLTADHQREIENQKQVVQALETRLANIKATRALLEPARSPEPVGPGGAVIITVAGVLGLMGGLFSAFVAEFLARVRQRRLEPAPPRTTQLPVNEQAA